MEKKMLYDFIGGMVNPLVETVASVGKAMTGSIYTKALEAGTNITSQTIDVASKSKDSQPKNSDPKKLENVDSSDFGLDKLLELQAELEKLRSELNDKELEITKSQANSVAIM